MQIGQYIKAYREAHDLSMDQFSERSGISKSYISVLELNKKPDGSEVSPTMGMYQKIANATNVTLDELFEIVADDKVTISPEKEAQLRDREEVSLIAEKLHKDPELRMLFSLARDAKPEDLKMCADMLRRFKETGR